jgi:hypothetical protein
MIKQLRFLIILCAFAACKPEPVLVPAEATVVFDFQNTAGTAPIELGKFNYKNSLDQSYKVSLLKYYISNITLVDDANNEINAGNYQLIDQEELSQNSFPITFKNGSYKKLRFKVGVPIDRNHNGAQDGFLDPSYGMIWTWNTGYIFLKIEGNFMSGTSPKALLGHLGTDKGLTTVEIPLTDFRIEGKAKKIYINFDLNTAFKTPNAIDFEMDGNHQSLADADSTWIRKMSENLTKAYQITKVE